MGLFKKRPAPEVETPIGPFRFVQGHWQGSIEHAGKRVCVVTPDERLGSAFLAVLEKLPRQVEELVPVAVSFAKKQSPWPDDYGPPDLEEVGCPDSTRPGIFLLRFDMQPPMPPIYLEVEIADGKPTRAEWEYV